MRALYNSGPICRAKQTLDEPFCRANACKLDNLICRANAGIGHVYKFLFATKRGYRFNRVRWTKICHLNDIAWRPAAECCENVHLHLHSIMDKASGYLMYPTQIAPCLCYWKEIETKFTFIKR